jgi:hypothetical protein
MIWPSILPQIVARLRDCPEHEKFIPVSEQIPVLAPDVL